MKFKAPAGKLVACQDRLLRFGAEGVFETDNEDEIKALKNASDVTIVTAKPKGKPKQTDTDLDTF